MSNMLTPQQIKDARKILDVTQKELAETIGVSLNTVGRWECGLTHCKGAAVILIRKLVTEKKSAIPA